MKDLVKYVLLVIVLFILNIYFMSAQNQSGFAKKSKDVLLFDYKDIKTDRNDQLSTNTQNIALDILPPPVPDDCDLINGTYITDANLYLSFTTKVSGEDYFSLLSGTSPDNLNFYIMSITLHFLPSSQLIITGTCDLDPATTGIPDCQLVNLSLTSANLIPDQMVKIDLSQHLTQTQLKNISSIEIALTNPSNFPTGYQFFLHSYYEEKKSIDLNVLNGLSCFNNGFLKIISPTKVTVKQTNTIVGVNNQVIFEWRTNSTVCTCSDLAFPHYQLQILKLDNISDIDPQFDLGDPSDFPVNVEVDWNKALTVETSNQPFEGIVSDTLFLKDGSGYYVWRVRPFTIQTGDNGLKEFTYGKWSYPECNGLNFSQGEDISIAGGVSTLEDKSGSGYSCSAFYYVEPEENLNWSFNRIFTEDIYNTSKSTESMTYLNYLLKPVQFQNVFKSDDYKFSSDKYRVVSQLFYDNVGRPSLQSIPVPFSVDNSTGLFGFNKNLFTNAATTPELYSKDDFDVSTYGISGNFNQPAPTSQTTDAGAYYSDANNDKRIPNSEGYNYTRTIYKNDGTGRVLQVGLPGSELKATADANKNYKFFQSGVSDIELRALFGEDAPDPQTVTKQITKDPNGVITYSYYNKEGQLIISCMSARCITPNLSLPVFRSWTGSGWSSTDDKIERVFINNFTLDFDDQHKLTDERTLALAETTSVTFHYSITPETFEELTECLGDEICYSCDYVIRLFIKNTQTGEIVDPGSGQDPVTTIVINPFDLCQVVGATITFDIHYSLPPGQYICVRKVSTGAEGDLASPYSPFSNYQEALIDDLKTMLDNNHYTAGSLWEAVNTKLNKLEDGAITLPEFYTAIEAMNGVTWEDKVVDDTLVRYLTINFGDCCPVTFTEYKCQDKTYLKDDEFEKYLFDKWCGRGKLVTDDDLGRDLKNYFYRDGVQIYLNNCPDVLDPTTTNGTFDLMIHHMSWALDPSHEYDLEKLSEIWINIVDHLKELATYRDNTGNYKLNTDFDLLDYFLSQAGYHFKAMSNHPCGNSGYISYAYSYFKDEEEGVTDRCSCKARLGYNPNTPWNEDHADVPFNEENIKLGYKQFEVLYNCFKMHKRDPNNSGNPLNNISNYEKDPVLSQFDNRWPDQIYTDYADFIAAIHDSCIDACTARAELFRKQLTLFYNNQNLSVQGQNFHFVGSKKVPDESPIESLSDYNIPAEQINCMVDALIADCGNMCDISNLGSPLDCSATNDGGRYNDLILAMVGSTTIKNCSAPNNVYDADQINSIRTVTPSSTNWTTDPVKQAVMQSKVKELNQLLQAYLKSDVFDRQSAFNDKYLNQAYSQEKYYYSSLGSFLRSPYRLNKNSIDIRNLVQNIFGSSACTWSVCDIDNIIENRDSADCTYNPNPDPIITSGGIESFSKDNLSANKYMRIPEKINPKNKKGEFSDKLLATSGGYFPCSCPSYTGCDSVQINEGDACSLILDHNLSHKCAKTIAKVFYFDNSPGWTYSFSIVNGKELHFIKHGGGYADCDITICDDVSPSDLCSLNICIDYYFDKKPEIPDHQKIEPIKCSETIADEIRQIISHSRDTCISNKVEKVTDAYKTTCNKSDFSQVFAQETSVTYGDSCYHYTLYYYDRAGNLITTVPPKGVEIDPRYTRASTPAHKYMTQYNYNSFGQVTHVKTPESSSDFYYNHRGQLRFSVNSRQANNMIGSVSADLFTYYRYDRLGRLIEKSESYGWENYVKPMLYTVIEDSDFPCYDEVLMGGLHSQIPTSGGVPLDDCVLKSRIRYFYDAPYSPLPLPYDNFKQRNTRNRLSYAACDNNPADHAPDNSGLSQILNFSPRYSNEVTTFFSYDVHGNTEWVIQYIPRVDNLETFRQRADIIDLGYSTLGMGENEGKYNEIPIISKIDYDYDLISGNVKKISYNKNRGDEFYQRYTYDLDNRVTQVESSRDDILYDVDASYSYYPTGELRSVKIGEDYLQDVDYTYTITGLPKAINHSKVASDPVDATDAAAPNRQKDADYLGDYYGAIAGYSPNDFKKTNSSFANSTSDNLPITGLSDGNMESVETGFNSVVKAKMDAVNSNTLFDQVSGEKFKYDRLYRLVGSDFHIYNSGQWSIGSNSRNKTYYHYDPNGNVDTLLRYKPNATSINDYMDRLFYTYIANTDQLSRVVEFASTSTNPDSYHDLKLGLSMMTYDAMGNLTTENAPGNGVDLTSSCYNMNEKQDTTTTSRDISAPNETPKRYMYDTTTYFYDAFGNLVATKTISSFPDNDGDGQPQKDIETNYTVPDASGIPLASYSFKYAIAQQFSDPNKYHFKYDYRRYVYGAAGQGRAAILLPDEVISDWSNYLFNPLYSIKLFDKMSIYPDVIDDNNKITALYSRNYHRGKKIYEIKDLQGTPRLVFSDKRYKENGADRLELLSVQNYYPYGMEIPFRTWAADAIRYGYQGMDKDSNSSPYGNYTTLFRGYDARKARWLQRDPIHHPWESSYSAFGGNPILYTDGLGADAVKGLPPDESAPSGGPYLGDTPAPNACTPGNGGDGPGLSQWMQNILNGIDNIPNNYNFTDITNALNGHKLDGTVSDYRTDPNYPKIMQGPQLDFSQSYMQNEFRELYDKIQNEPYEFSISDRATYEFWNDLQLAGDYLMFRLDEKASIQDIRGYRASESQGQQAFVRVVSSLGLSGMIKVAFGLKGVTKAQLEIIEAINSESHGFKSFAAFKRAMGKAGPGMEWHHIVEQTDANVAKFGAESIHNTNNLIKIEGGFSGSLHSRVSAYYSTKQRFTNGLTVRQWLKTKSFEEQYKFGIEKLKEYGWKP